MEKGWCGCSFPFALGPVLILWGVIVLATAIATTSVTTSFFAVFPAGAPIWTGSLFTIVGCFLLAVFRPREQPLVMPNKSQVLFTLVVAIVAGVEALLAAAMSVWYSQDTFPALEKCSSTFPLPTNDSFRTCECSTGFIDPPSLRRVVYTFERVSGSCSDIKTSLVTFTYVLLGLYCVGAGMSILLVLAACRKLHSLGLFGKSGIYLVTPEVNSGPTATTNVSRQPSFASSHPSGPAPSLYSHPSTVGHTTHYSHPSIAGFSSHYSHPSSAVHRLGANSQDTLDRSPAMRPVRPHSSQAMI